MKEPATDPYSSPREPLEERARWFKKLGLAMTVPMILLSGPLIGLVAGMWLDRHFHTAPWILVAGVTLGLLSSAREVFDIIRRINQEDKRGRKEPGR